MATRGPGEWDYTDLPPGSDERHDMAVTAVAGAEGGCNADQVIADWGEFEEDYTEEELQAADGVGDPYTYYDSCNSADNDFKILGN